MADPQAESQREGSGIMAVGDALTKTKPFVFGLVVGVAVAAIVGFSTGWVVTAGAKERAVWTAKVDRLAAICAAQATDQWQAQGGDVAALRGWDGREKREQLVEQVATALRLEGPLARDVGSECSRRLDPW